MSYKESFGEKAGYSSVVQVELILSESSDGHTHQRVQIDGSASLDRDQVEALVAHLQSLAEHLED